jgi:hypothetical protein
VKAEDKIHLPAADCDEEGDLFNDGKMNYKSYSFSA